MYQDTIFALASARGRAGVAVIRISGPHSDDALLALTNGRALPSPRLTAVRRLVDPLDQAVLDEALILRFADGASFTGEASVEIQCHGGPAVVSAILKCLGKIPELRLADPGEFTRRAFDNGQLDLVQIEGLADLISAETEAQHRAAIRQADGSLGRLVKDWSVSLTKSCALLEATIDFADEDIPDSTFEAVSANVFHVKQSIQDLIDNATFSERFRDGWRIALIGSPNAGKSSLINALTQRDVAIISPIAGTTRDAIEVSLDLKGYPVTLIDTAGMRETDDVIETEGVARTQRRAETADLRIALTSHDALLSKEVTALLNPDDLIVWNKSDLVAANGNELQISAKTGDGLDHLIEQISQKLDFSDPSDASALLRDRHDAALRQSLIGLESYARLDEAPDSPVRDNPEIAAEYLRLARAALGTITGDVGVERLLDVIFSEFCLGK